MPVIPALRRLGQKNQKFKISWGYIVRPPSQKKKNKRTVGDEKREKRKKGGGEKRRRIPTIVSDSLAWKIFILKSPSGQPWSITSVTTSKSFSCHIDKYKCMIQWCDRDELDN